MAQGDTLFDTTVKRYDQELSRTHHLDNKAGTQIGFSGIIIAILSFVFGSLEFEQISNNEHLWIFALGIGVLLISVAIGIAALTRFKKTLPVFLPEKFYDKFGKLDEAKQKEQILLGFFDLIYDFDIVNNRKAKILYAGNIATIIGLLISFISFLMIYKVFG